MARAGIELRKQFTDGARGDTCTLVVDPDRPLFEGLFVEHGDCIAQADVSADLDAWYCTLCERSGRISGAWAVYRWELAAGYALPEVITDEDGETAWTPGHISPHLFVRAVVRFMRTEWNGYEDDTVRELLRDHGGHLGMVAAVKHTAFRYDNPRDDESMSRCEVEHPEAELFTELSLV